MPDLVTPSDITTSERIHMLEFMWGTHSSRMRRKGQPSFTCGKCGQHLNNGHMEGN